MELVVNVSRRSAGVRWDVYVGRGRCPCAQRSCPHGPTGFGNPFSVVTHGSDAMVLYIDHLAQRIRTQPAFARALDGLRGKVLGCWCKPRGCHGDVLAAVAAAPNDPARLNVLAELRREAMAVIRG